MGTSDDRYSGTVAALRAAGCVYAEDEARLLLEDGRDLEPLLARRVAGEPLEWVLGRAQFREDCGVGVDVVVHPGVFVPRRRTLAIAIEADCRLPFDGIAVDLCCGSGAIAAYLSEMTPGATVYATDIDPVAIACARENLPNGIVLAGDLFEPLPESLLGSVDVIVANTPYVPSSEIAFLPPEARKYEPLHTLDGGSDGLDVLRRISADAPRWLKPGGSLIIEINDRQFPAARAAFVAAGLITEGHTQDDGTAVIAGQLPDRRPGAK